MHKTSLHTGMTFFPGLLLFEQSTTARFREMRFSWAVSVTVPTTTKMPLTEPDLLQILCFTVRNCHGGPGCTG